MWLTAADPCSPEPSETAPRDTTHDYTVPAHTVWTVGSDATPPFSMAHARVISRPACRRVARRRNVRNERNGMATVGTGCSR